MEIMNEMSTDAEVYHRWRCIVCGSRAILRYDGECADCRSTPEARAAMGQTEFPMIDEDGQER